MRVSAFAKLCMAVTSCLTQCTFPSVDYASGDASATACTLPPTSLCAQETITCGNQATLTLDACINGCTTPDCQSGCNATSSSARETCVTACEACAASECGGRPTDCAALVGG